MDDSLFPNKEEWGTGDEAMDIRLTVASKKVRDSLSFESISEFYFFGLSQKPRVPNPSFTVTIELVTKAFLFSLEPTSFNDQLMLKVKGQYYAKKKVPFSSFPNGVVEAELRKDKKFRYHDQIDFYLHHQDTQERNPFVRQLLSRSPVDLHAKIIMKDFKNYLNGEKDESFYENPLFRALRIPDHILFIDHFAELWYHQGQLFALPLFDS